MLRDSRPTCANHHLIWFPGHIPRHAFILWLATRCRLNTRDRTWFLGEAERQHCMLCLSSLESHDHLFFQCPYSLEVWSKINREAGLAWPNILWKDLLHWASLQLSGQQASHDYIAKIILATTVYYIWLERNNRMFNQVHKSTTSLVVEIHQLIRLHLASAKLSHPLPPETKVRWNISNGNPFST
ncbi:hypothetical protein SADUNF_Sadunf18G0118000 [Salix dunnii]|uniref:Reverse transcriptase zinc-binding domain-containing protein n=1 Tax=Salix dunnii TaxID=1413687 RepID=A0A835MJC1_9ROSI|nr:hypothetical protein SADUNF_Sadunf18G0118000 [Salix dunnii]